MPEDRKEHFPIISLTLACKHYLRYFGGHNRLLLLQNPGEQHICPAHPDATQNFIINSKEASRFTCTGCALSHHKVTKSLQPLAQLNSHSRGIPGQRGLRGLDPEQVGR